MIRLLVVLAILGLAYMYFAGGADRNGQPVKPEEQYRQQQQRVETMEQQLQEQSARQLEAIDAQSVPATDGE